MLLNQALCLGHLLGFEAEIGGQLHVRINPELRLTAGVLNVNMERAAPRARRSKTEIPSPEIP